MTISPFGVNPDTIGAAWQPSAFSHPSTPRQTFLLIAEVFSKLQQTLNSQWTRQYLPAQLPWQAYEQNMATWDEHPGSINLPNAGYLSASFLAAGISQQDIETWLAPHLWNNGQTVLNAVTQSAVPHPQDSELVSTLSRDGVPSWRLLAPALEGLSDPDLRAEAFMAWMGETVRRVWPLGSLNPANKPPMPISENTLMLVTAKAKHQPNVTYEWWVRSDARLGTLLQALGAVGAVAMHPTTDVGFGLPYGFSVIVGPHSRAKAAGVAAPDSTVGSILRPGWTVETLPPSPKGCSGNPATSPMLTVHSTLTIDDSTLAGKDRMLSMLAAEGKTHVANDHVWTCGGLLPTDLTIKPAAWTEPQMAEGKTAHRWWQVLPLQRD